MIAYNTTWLANLRVQDAVKVDADRGLITRDEFKAIAARYHVGFYTPNLFVRIGLFVLTCFIVLFSDGLLSLVLLAGGIKSIAGWFIFLGVITYGALELMIYTGHHYRSGVDDALLYIAAAQIGGGLCAGLLDTYHPDYLAVAGIILLLGIGFTLRFTDMLVSAICAVAFFAFVFFLWIRITPAGLATAPFAMMFFSGGLYWLARRYKYKVACINYYNCLLVIQTVSLLAFYASGNYYVIQTLSSGMAGNKGPVPFGGVFWVWTFAIPTVYIWFGLRNKDAMLLRISLVLTAAAGFTFRNYYHILPPDIALTIVGTILLSAIFGISRYLKTPKQGITADEPDDANIMDKLKVESLVAAGSFSHAPAAPANNGNSSFGGGSFGGGGSSSGY